MNMKILSEPFHARQAVLGFTGWPDAGQTVEHTMAEVAGVLGSKPVADWDMDGFWYTDSSFRPQLTVQHGQIRKLQWPLYRFSAVSPSPSESVLLGIGPEPASQWRLFTKELLDQLKQWGCEEIILLGSVYDQIFHDELMISSVVQDSRSYNLVLELGCRLIEYNGPASIHSAIMEAARDVDIHCLGFWAHLPYYLNGPHELVTAHCLQLLGKLIHAEFEVDHLIKRWREREKEIQKLIEINQELRNAVESIKREKALEGLPLDSSKVVSLDEFKKRHESEPEVE